MECFCPPVQIISRGGRTIGEDFPCSTAVLRFAQDGRVQAVVGLASGDERPIAAAAAAGRPGLRGHPQIDVHVGTGQSAGELVRFGSRRFRRRFQSQFRGHRRRRPPAHGHRRYSFAQRALFDPSPGNPTGGFSPLRHPSADHEVHGR